MWQTFNALGFQLFHLPCPARKVNIKIQNIQHKHCNYAKITITGGGSTTTHSKAISADKKILSLDFKFFTFSIEMIYRGERGKEL